MFNKHVYTGYDNHLMFKEHREKYKPYVTDLERYMARFYHTFSKWVSLLVYESTYIYTC
ncbi:MAG: hypothetical protein US98_C0046G0003 [Parcubacteria group bacterium GW2011_GWC1_38_6]|nr:MAG: hypothetical protein US98_C0046G0003 [Parcubacteria group bacterium GW2011_GWC1_38_6]